MQRRHAPPPGHDKALPDARSEASSLDEGLLGIWRAAVRSGGRLPTEKEIATLLGVGRGSVREALIRLEAEGLVARRHGAGTFANPAALDDTVRIDRTGEYAQLLVRARIAGEVEVLESGWTELDAEGARRLGRPEGTLAFRTVKRWLARSTPVMLATDIVPAARRLAVDPAGSVFELAWQLSARRTDWVSTLLGAELAGPAAEQLGCSPGEPLLHLDQLGVTRDGAACWWAREHHRSSLVSYGLVRTVMPDPYLREPAG